jgi:hypothetical protein
MSNDKFVQPSSGIVIIDEEKPKLKQQPPLEEREEIEENDEE